MSRTFKTDVIVFIGNIILCLTGRYFSVSESVCWY